MPDDEFDFPDTPHAVEAIRGKIREAFDTLDQEGRKVGNAKHGVYLFFDYDGEPIYVGQTYESLRQRISRHLTNQRTDAVAMNVLDPFEVAEIEMWPFWDLEGVSKAEAKELLSRAEFTVYQRALAASVFGAVLNEKDVPFTELIDLPSSHRARIIPDELYPLRKHPDVRIARRAATIANLARVISERSVNVGLRQTLLTQARRLEWLARKRLEDAGGELPLEEPGEETGEESAPVASEEDA
jgi:hypothetical protein